MVTGSALANPHVINLTAFFMWVWGLLPTPWSNALLRAYLYMRDTPDRMLNQTVRTSKAILNSFQNDEYWFYKAGSHYFSQHSNSSAMKVYKGKPQWLYTPHNTLFSWIDPITTAASVESMREIVQEPVVYKRLPIIGAVLYLRTERESFEYDMSDWISQVKLMAPQTHPVDHVPLVVLVLAWGLTQDICFEGDLSSSELVITSDMGEEKRFRVLTEEEIEDGEIVEDWGGQEHVTEADTEILDKVSSTDSDESPAPSSRPLQSTPVEENT